jgi:hypothetical protein
VPHGDIGGMSACHLLTGYTGWVSLVAHQALDGRGLRDHDAQSPLPVEVELREGVIGAYGAGVAASASPESGVAVSAATSNGAVSAPSGT